jgi:hypothetical protein
MPGLSRRAIATTAAGIVGVILVGQVSTLVISRDYDGQLALLPRPVAFTPTRATGEILGGRSVGQTILATRSGLSEVEVRLSTYTRQYESPLLLRIRDPLKANSVIRTSIAPPNSLADNQYHSFLFRPILESMGRTYLVSLEAPEAQTGHAVTAWLNEEDEYPEGFALLGSERRLQADVVMNVSYRTEISGPSEELLNRVSQYKPRFFKGWILGILLVLAGGVVVAVTVAVITSVLTAKEDRQPEN